MSKRLFQLLAVTAMLAGCGDAQLTIDRNGEKIGVALEGRLTVTLSGSGQRHNISLSNGVMSIQERSADSSAQIAITANERAAISDVAKTVVSNFHVIGPGTLSPNGEVLAVGGNLLGRVSPFVATSIALADSKTKSVLATYSAESGDSIEAFAWAPNSQRLAILVAADTSYGKMPGGLLSWLGGHPVPYSSFQLVVVDLQARPIYT